MTKSTKQQKKQMTRQERKAYKKAQREGLPTYYTFVEKVTPKNPKNRYTQLVSRDKAFRMIYGTWNPIDEAFVKTRSDEWQQVQATDM